MTVKDILAVILADPLKSKVRHIASLGILSFVTRLNFVLGQFILGQFILGQFVLGQFILGQLYKIS